MAFTAPTVVYAVHNAAGRSLATLPDVLDRSEEHTSELQSLTNLVCRLLLEKKKKTKKKKKRKAEQERPISSTCRMSPLYKLPLELSRTSW